MTLSSTPDSSTVNSSEGFDEGGVLLDRPAGVSCPACKSGLVIGEIAGCKFAGCPDCKGVLFQNDVFANLVQHLRSNSTASLTQTPFQPRDLDVCRYCPSCKNMFETHPYGGPGNAVIDSCFPCQLIWLDQGEFSKLVHASGRR